MTFHIWRSRKTLLIIWKFEFAHKKYEKGPSTLNFQFHRCFVKNSKASDGSRQWKPDLSWFDRFLRRLYHRWSTCPLVFWLLALESHDLSQAERGHSITTWTRFWLFWLPTYLDVDIFYPKRGQKEALHCPRSFWTTPR